MDSRGHSPVSDLVSFDRQLHSQYGSYASMPVCDRASATGNAYARQCGPYHALMVRARNLVSRRPAMSGDWLNSAFLLMLLEGRSRVSHYGKSVLLERGDVFIMDSQAPLEISIPGDNRSVCISIDRSDMLALPKRAEDLFGSKISGRQGLPNLLVHMLRALLNDAHRYHATERRIVTDSLLSIIDNHLAHRDADAVVGAQEGELIGTIKTWMLEHLDHPELDVDAVARQFNMSRSSLYRLFGSTGETPRSWIMQRRLHRARTELADPSKKHLSICTICFNAGFNDAAHFSRLFRQTFGVSPLGYRNARLPPAAHRRLK